MIRLPALYEAAKLADKDWPAAEAMYRQIADDGDPRGGRGTQR